MGAWIVTFRLVSILFLHVLDRLGHYKAACRRGLQTNTTVYVFMKESLFDHRVQQAV